MIGFSDQVTIGEKYTAAMSISDPFEAGAYFERCVTHTMRVRSCERREAETIERLNLAYFAAYYTNETRARVESLFHCVHPIFGAVSDGVA